MDRLEVEIKAWCGSHDDIREAVISRGGNHEETVTERDTYFNHPSRDFRITDEAVRIRQSGRDSYLTYKGPKLSGRGKTRREEELLIDDPEKMRSILLELGFTEVGRVEKEREIYCLNGVHITLDRVAGLGNFVELEKMDSDYEKVEKKLFDLAGELGLERFERRSYLELILRKLAGESIGPP